MPKVYRLADGGTVSAPREERDSRTIAAYPLGSHLGAPLVPSGDPMRDGVGPAAYAQRAHKPDLLTDGKPMIVPVRLAEGFHVADGDPDPRGMQVLGADRSPGGTVVDIWVDRAEAQIRYLEVEAANARRLLLPINFTRFDTARRRIHVKSILGSQFIGVPSTESLEYVTRLEEDRIMAYFAGGHLYATPARSEPLL